MAGLCLDMENNGRRQHSHDPSSPLARTRRCLRAWITCGRRQTYLRDGCLFVFDNRLRRLVRPGFWTALKPHRERCGRIEGIGIGVAAISHEILVSLNALRNGFGIQEIPAGQWLLYFHSFGIVAFWRPSRNCGTVPLFRARLGWVSGSAESITAVNELSRDPRLSRRESANPSRRRLDLPGGGWM
jgi:hypothetical protein